MTNHILKHDGKMLTALFKTLKKLDEINALCKTHLDEKLAAHCHVGSIEKDTLVVIADNGNWATQFRFQIPDLLENLRRYPMLCALRSITCKTRPNPLLEKFTKKPRKMKPLSAKAAEEIRSNAAKIVDPKLRKVLEKIASRSSS